MKKGIIIVLALTSLILLNGCSSKKLDCSPLQWGFDISKCHNFSICDWDNCSYYDNFEDVKQICGIPDF